MRGARKLPGHPNDISGFYTSDLLLPGWRIRQILIKAGRAGFIAETVINAVVGKQQIVDGSHQNAFTGG